MARLITPEFLKLERERDGISEELGEEYDKLNRIRDNLTSEQFLRRNELKLLFDKLRRERIEKDNILDLEFKEKFTPKILDLGKECDIPSYVLKDSCDLEYFINQVVMREDKVGKNGFVTNRWTRIMEYINYLIMNDEKSSGLLELGPEDPFELSREYKLWKFAREIMKISPK
jgi:hypothetical protein